jgi:hypothetical protein
MSEPASPRGDDRSDLIAALEPATSPIWWRVYLEHLEKARRYREMDRDTTGKGFRDVAAELRRFADQYAEVAGTQTSGFWRARERLMSLCPKAWALLPHPGSDLSRTDPEEHAAAVRQAVAILAESTWPTVGNVRGEDTNPPPPAETPKGLKEPSARAFAAYRLVKILGQSQADVEKTMGVDQSTVSRWVNSVGKWIEAGNVLPDEMRADPPRRKPTPMDPTKLDQGPRLDRRGNPRRRKEDG